jgi:hypothetical protein
MLAPPSPAEVCQSADCRTTGTPVGGGGWQPLYSLSRSRRGSYYKSGGGGGGGGHSTYMLRPTTGWVPYSGENRGDSYAAIRQIALRQSFFFTEAWSSPFLS